MKLMKLMRLIEAEWLMSASQGNVPKVAAKALVG